MAKYRYKTPQEILWNKIRRRITREFDTQIADWRESVLNDLLSGAHVKFLEAMESGEQRVLEANYNDFVAGALDDAIGLPEIKEPKP